MASKELPTSSHNGTLHETLYNAIRSNNVQAITNLFNNLSSTADVAVSVISKTYEEVKTKNIPLNTDTQYLLESKLLDLLFLSQHKNEVKNFYLDVTHHLNFTCELISSFISKYNCQNDFEVDMEFIYRSRYVAQHLSVLKRNMVYSYEILPWEEMQFYMAMYLKTLISAHKVDVTFKLLMQKRCFLQYLYHFNRTLLEARTEFKEGDLNSKRSIKRSILKGSVLKRTPEFEELYNDFYILRDIYSLEKITRSIDNALIADIKEDVVLAHLTIQRSLQVIGEYVKDSPDSPNLSENLYESLARAAPRHLKAVLKSLRNTLSHAFALDRKLTLEASKDSTFFVNIQEDLRKIKSDVLYVSYKLKIEAVKKFLKRLLEMSSIEDIKRSCVGIDLEVTQSVRDYGDNLRDFIDLKGLISVLCQKILDKTDQAKNLTEIILSQVNDYELKIELIAHKYVEGINRVFKVLRTHKNLRNIKNIIQTYLETLTASEPQSPFNEIGKNLYTLHRNFETWMKQNHLESEVLKLSQYQTHHTKTVLKPDSISLLYLDIFKYMYLRCPNIMWIGEMDELLTATGDEMENERVAKEIFLKIERKLGHEDASYLRNEIEIVQQRHSTKKGLAKALEDPEEFQHKLKALISKPDRLKTIINNYKANKFDKVKMAIKQIDDVYGGLLKNLPDILPPKPFIEYIITFFENLNVKESVSNQLPQVIKESTDDYIKLCYSKRLSALKVVLDRFDFEINSEHLVPSLEIIVLDLLEVLENVNLLGNNNNLLLENCPILMGKQLRNYLAHGDVLMEVLPCNPLIAVVFYARKLFDCGESILDHRGVSLIGNRSFKGDFGENFTKCIEMIGKQEQLFRCAHKGSITLFEDLVNAGSDSLGCNNYTGWNVLHYALSGSNFFMFQHLSKNLEEQAGYELLHMATAMGNIEIMNFLINNKQLNINKKLAGTLLNEALKHEHPDAASYLLHQDFALEIGDAQGKTPLHWAAERGYSEIVERIVYLYSDIVDLRTDEGLTALNLACRFGHALIVKQLLKSDAIGECFQEAAAYGHDDLLIYFLEEHTVKDEDFGKALRLASENAYWPAIETLIQRVTDEDAKHKYLRKASQVAVTYGHVDILANLLLYGIDLRGENFLHVAAQNGHLNVIQELLDAGFSPNTPMGHEQRTPLHWACCIDNVPVVQQLLSHPEITVNVQDKEQKTPLHLAVENGHLEVLLNLLDCDANPHLTLNNGFTSLHLATQAGYLSIVDKLVNFCSVDLNVKDSINNETALIIAALKGFTSIVELLLKAGADLTCKTKDSGRTALMHAASRGHVDIVRALLKRRTDIIDDSDDNGWTALHYSAHKNYNDVVNILIKYKANVHKANNTGKTALYLAAMSGNLATVQKLIDAGSKVSTNAEGKFSPLYIATICLHPQVVEVLLQNGAEIDEESLNFVAAIEKMYQILKVKPPAMFKPHLDILHLFREQGARVRQQEIDTTVLGLHLIAKKGGTAALRVFIKSPADLYAENDIGANVLHVACEAGQEDLVKVLIDEFRMPANIKSGTGATGLHFAAAHDRLKVVETLIYHYRVDINTRANDGSTALHWACQSSGSLSIIQKLIECGANVNVTDAKEVTPLHLASMRGHEEVVKELLLKGANVNAEGHELMPLHAAVVNGHLDVARALLQAGADKNRVTLHNRSCLHWAVQNNHKDLVKLLLDYRIDTSLVDNNNLTALRFASVKGHHEIIHIFNEFHVFD